MQLDRLHRGMLVAGTVLGTFALRDLPDRALRRWADAGGPRPAARHPAHYEGLVVILIPAAPQHRPALLPDHDLVGKQAGLHARLPDDLGAGRR